MRFTPASLLVLVFAFIRPATAQYPPANDRQFVASILSAARSYVGQSDFNQAATLLKQAIAAQAQASVDPAVSTPLLAKLADVYGNLKDWPDQEKTFASLAAIWAITDGPNSAIVAHFLLDEAAAFRKIGNIAEADAIEQKTIAIFNEIYGANNYAVQAAIQRCASCRVRNFDEQKAAINAAHSPAVPSTGKQMPVIIAPQPMLSTMEGGVRSPPKLLSKVEPAYSERARHARHEGTVVLKILINALGEVEQAWIVNPLGLGLDDEAIRAVRRWKFEPGTNDGQPVRVAANVEVNFHLL